MPAGKTLQPNIVFVTWFGRLELLDIPNLNSTRKKEMSSTDYARLNSDCLNVE